MSRLHTHSILAVAAGIGICAACAPSAKENPFDPGKKDEPDPTPPEEENNDDPAPSDTLVFPDRPNIIVILADDLGYSDLGCYGSEVSTPSLDRLAENGIRYRTFYNAARSAPTRASLLTGVYPHQAGFGALNAVEGYDHYRAWLMENTTCIPEVLKSAGYFSFITGKWHLNQEHSKPMDKGFNHSLFFGGGWYWNDDPSNTGALFRDDAGIKRKGANNGLPGGNNVWYTSDMFVTMGLQWMDEAISSGKPFFWYMPFNAVHFPVQAKKETIDKYTGSYSEGYTVIRNRRFAKQVRMGLFDEGMLSPENPHPDYKHWDQMGSKEKTKADKRMAVYAACIENMDTNVGRILAHLEEKGILENTLIFFLSDNGGNAESGWPGTYDTGTEKFPGGPGESGSNIWLGAPWAGVANTPYYLYKRHAHNGGCCTPFIMSWPAGIDKSLNGTIDKVNYGHITDLMPTILEVAGAKYPVSRREVTDGRTYNVIPMEGTSLTPSMKGQVVARTKPIIVEHEGAKMLRQGDWKIVREFEFGNSGKTAESTEAQNPWRLYNVVEDPSELHDLAAQNPSLVQSMVATYKSEAARTCVESGLLWVEGPWYSPVRNYPKIQ